MVGCKNIKVDCSLPKEPANDDTFGWHLSKHLESEDIKLQVPEFQDTVPRFSKLLEIFVYLSVEFPWSVAELSWGRWSPPNRISSLSGAAQPHASLQADLPQPHNQKPAHLWFNILLIRFNLSRSFKIFVCSSTQVCGNPQRNGRHACNPEGSQPGRSRRPLGDR